MYSLMLLSMVLIVSQAVAGEEEAKTAEISQEELVAAVPALDELHEVVYLLWHDAFPVKDTGMIKELLPQADSLTANLDAAKLPGILRDKQAAWDAEKAKLIAALEGLHASAEADDEEGMLKQTEAFHTAFERLMRTIRPVVPALEAFHQELYKLYHYYAPEYDLAQIRTASAAMKERIPPLAESKLPSRLADRQKDFDKSVQKLSTAVDALVTIAQKDDKDAILAAVGKVHTAYQRTEHIFD
jgi:cytochrome c556